MKLVQPKCPRSVSTIRDAPIACEFSASAAEHGLHLHSPMPGNNQSIDRLADHVRALPLADQLELLLKIAPTIVAELDEDDRAMLVANINQAIAQHTFTSR